MGARPNPQAACQTRACHACRGCRMQSSFHGLSVAEAEKRLIEYGPNKLPESTRNALLVFLGYMWNPLSWAMEAAAIIAICLLDYADFALIVGLLILNSCISYIEEANADKAIKVGARPGRRGGAHVALPAWVRACVLHVRARGVWRVARRVHACMHAAGPVRLRMLLLRCTSPPARSLTPYPLAPVPWRPRTAGPCRRPGAQV